MSANASHGRSRRLLLLGGAAAGGAALYLGAPALLRLAPQRFDFAEMTAPAGFRTLEGGSVSAGFDPLAGLSSRPGEATAPDVLRADLCARLFGAPPAPGVVPVASFSDYACPFCRVLTERLAAIAETPGVAVRWHEWPLLGPRSEALARAALAAARQDAYPAFHAALMGSAFVPTGAYLRALAERNGLDPERLLADMTGEAVSRRLADSRGLARLYGFIGTPALVVGRTVVQGAITEARLRALIDLEREAGPPPGCA
ncbi:DsbA family protein [Rubrimonas cliftonensis]|uniref:Protein-disulfide isomerase n=1 Tax=Rubrimonas cliftonensis TaxID=89524 RepID=A0A1H4E251_9RHOB|nr:DsbA family protein [Rubrimonas cliftonensis]SEA79113.1 Protein-disulfide isomerase [Rubrimonas cliftonensis]